MLFSRTICEGRTSQRPRRAWRRLAAGAAAVLLAAWLHVPTASASFAGSNGLIAFKRGNDIYTATSTGADVKRLTTLGGAAPRWSRDGTRIAFVRGDGVYVMAADGSGQRRLATGRQPNWSPQGEVVFTADVVYPEYGCLSPAILQVATTAGAVPRVLVPNGDCGNNDSPWEPSFPGYGPTGDLLYQNNKNGRGFTIYDVVSSSFGTSWHLICDDGPPYGNVAGCNASFRGDWFQPDYQPTGRNVLLVSDVAFTGTTDGHRRLWLQDAQSTWHKRVGSDTDVADPTSSPDGTQAVYSVLHPGVPTALRSYTFATGQTRTLLTDAVQPDWQPAH